MSMSTLAAKITSELLWAAVRDANLEEVRSILNGESSHVECETFDSWSIVQEAALLGHLALLNYFKSVSGLSQYLTRVAKDHHAQTPLVCAIAHGQVEAFKILWQWLDEEGQTDSFLLNQGLTDRYQWSLLGWAVYSGSPDAVDYILSLKLPGMDIRSSKPPLFSAAMTKGSVDLIRHLIDLGVDVNACPDGHQSPLTIAVRRGVLDVVKTMILYGKADYNARDDRGNTALDIAEKYGQFECADFLRAIMLKEGSLDASTNDNFSMSVYWFRPRLLGPLLSARACALSTIIDNYLYITAGQGFKEGEPCLSPDNYKSPPPHALSYRLYRTSLPALDLPMLPPDMPFLHSALTTSYETALSQIPAPKLRKMHLIGDQPSPSPHAQHWSTKYGSELNQIADDARLEVKYSPTSVQAPAVTFARLPLPKQLPFAYFEISLLDVGQYGYIAIGISKLCDDTEQHLGWTPNAYGCHADIGCVFHHSSSGAAFAPKFQKNDVIGCGIDFTRHELFYTVNGKWIGASHQGVDITVDWHPAISLQSPGEHISANFGAEPFLFDFMAPTLTLESLPATTTLGEHIDGPSRLARAPKSSTSTELALIRFGARTLNFLIPNPLAKIGKANNRADERRIPEKEEPLWNDDQFSEEFTNVVSNAIASLAYAEWTWKTINLSVEPTSSFSAYDFWRGVPPDPSTDLSCLSTESHFFCVSQTPNQAQSQIVFSVFGIEWSTGLVSRVDLPPLSMTKKATASVYRVECSLDSTQLLAWSFYVPEIYAIDVSSIFESIRAKTTAKDLTPVWTTSPSVGPHPPSSRLALAPLSDQLTLAFGGFEEIAPQNTVTVLDSRASAGPKWLKPRINGCTLPRARFFSTLSSAPAAQKSTTDETKFKSIATPHGPLSYHPHLQNDGHDYTIYAICGWNGWTGVYDFDIAHVSLPKPTVDSVMTALNDISVVAHDGTIVETAKIMLYCRASFFRTFFAAPGPLTSDSNINAQLKTIQLSEVLASVSGEKINGSALRVLIGFLVSDKLTKSAIDSITNLLTAVEIICPEHLPRIRDELFASRMTHPSTFSEDLARSLDPTCPILYDMHLLPTIIASDASEDPLVPIPSSSATPSAMVVDTLGTNQLKMHTYIAALKSSFFRAMVHGDFLESRLADGVRTVPLQTDSSLAKLFIDGLCTGKVDLDLVGDRIIDLFELSHSLQATELLDFIESVLCSNVDSNNVEMLESVANDHSAFKLLDACSAFRSASHRSAPQ